MSHSAPSGCLHACCTFGHAGVQVTVSCTWCSLPICNSLDLSVYVTYYVCASQVLHLSVTLACMQSHVRVQVTSGSRCCCGSYASRRLHQLLFQWNGHRCFSRSVQVLHNLWCFAGSSALFTAPLCPLPPVWPVLFLRFRFLSLPYICILFFWGRASYFSFWFALQSVVRSKFRTTTTFCARNVPSHVCLLAWGCTGFLCMWHFIRVFFRLSFLEFYKFAVLLFF